MEVEVHLGPEVRKVTIERRPGRPESYRFYDPEIRKSRRLTILQRGPSHLLLSVDDKIYSVRPVSHVAGEITFLLNGERVTAGRPSRGGKVTVGSDIASVDELVVSHFPAKVVRVLVAKDARARAGETLLVLEAMKLETNLDAPRDCKVLEVFVKEGEMVARGSKLARLDFS